MVMEAPDSKTGLELAGLDWSVLQKTIETQNGIPIPGFQANLRDRDNKILGVPEPDGSKACDEVLEQYFHTARKESSIPLVGFDEKLKRREEIIRLMKKLEQEQKQIEQEIKRALPTILTPERFMRMTLPAINNTPELAECTPMSFSQR